MWETDEAYSRRIFFSSLVITARLYVPLAASYAFFMSLGALAKIDSSRKNSVSCVCILRLIASCATYACVVFSIRKIKFVLTWEHSYTFFWQFPATSSLILIERQMELSTLLSISGWQPCLSFVPVIFIISDLNLTWPSIENDQHYYVKREAWFSADHVRKCRQRRFYWSSWPFPAQELRRRHASGRRVYSLVYIIYSIVCL